jgi:hypothetical protein
MKSLVPAFLVPCVCSFALSFALPALADGPPAKPGSVVLPVTEIFGRVPRPLVTWR